MKIVTLRSPNSIANQTAVVIEMIIVNDAKQQVGDITVIEAAGNASVPLGSGFYNSVRVRPQGFGYTWSQPISWKHLKKDKMSKLKFFFAISLYLTIYSAGFLSLARF
jgi:hypothetical protein